MKKKCIRIKRTVVKNMSKEKRSKKEMSDTKRVVLFTFVIVLVVVLIGVTSFFVLREKDEEKENETVKTNTQEISGYGITVDDLDSEYYKLEFEKLKANKESKNVDMDAYAEKYGEKAVRKNLTIPAWLNTFAENNHINFSQVLQDSLTVLYQQRQQV